jgi:hypothetical protein
MTHEAHQLLHKQVANKYNSSDLHKQHNVQRSNAMNKLWSDPARRKTLEQNMQIRFDDRCVSYVINHVKMSGKHIGISRMCKILSTDELFNQHLKKINANSQRDLTKSYRSATQLESLLQRATGKNYLQLIGETCQEVALTPWFKRAVKKSQQMKGFVPKFVEQHVKNHKVAKVEKLNEVSDVYCMEVVGPNGQSDRHNFAVLSNVSGGNYSTSGVIVSNCKYGDFFLYNDVSPTYGVVNAFPVPVNEIEREENYDREDPFAVRYRWVTLGNRTLENWEITHFRLLGNDMFLPYGSSVIEPARRIWRQLILIEDAMLVYRVVRAPERRVFYIDVANVPPENVPAYIEEQRKNLRTNQVVDQQTGRVDLRYNPLCVSLQTLIKLQNMYSDLADSSVYLSFTAPNKDRGFYESESKKYYRLFIGVTERIIWILKKT